MAFDVEKITRVKSGLQFRKWLGNSGKGDICEYHVGDMARSRHDSTDKKAEKAVQRKAKEASTVGDAAWAAYEWGDVVLYQRRITDFCFSYLAKRI